VPHPPAQPVPAPPGIPRSARLASVIPGAPPLPAPQPSTGCVLAEQAIFTSLPSVMGEGYRIVAVSAGLRPNEKTEITRRCPSHEGLCDPGPDAVGLLTFALAGGRYCVGHARKAGLEHTGRGGERILTHSVVLDREAFRQFDCDPLRVHAVLAQVRLPMLSGEAAQALPQLALPLHPAVGGRSRSWTGAGLTLVGEQDRAGLAIFVSELLRPDAVPWIVVGVQSPLAWLEFVLAALPLALRERLSVSVGIRYALARQVQIALIPPDDGQTQRVIRGHSVRWFDWPVPPADAGMPCTAWINLVQRWLREGRRDELMRLTEVIPAGVGPVGLERLADIAEDYDQLETVRRMPNPGVRERILQKYVGYSPANAAEALLVKPIWEAGRPAAS